MTLCKPEDAREQFREQLGFVKDSKSGIVRVFSYENDGGDGGIRTHE